MHFSRYLFYSNLVKRVHAMLDPICYNASFVRFDANLKHKTPSVLRTVNNDTIIIISMLFVGLLWRHNQWHVCIQQALEETPFWICAREVMFMRMRLSKTTGSPIFDVKKIIQKWNFINVKCMHIMQRYICVVKKKLV